jgi:glycosyltransferase involved in cell wall biosynthesis
MIIPEDFIEVAQNAMDLDDASLSQLSYDELAMCFMCTYLAAQTLQVKDTETARLRAYAAETADRLLSKIAVYELPEEVIAPFEGKRLFIPSSDHWRTWTNTELLKDKCLSGLHIARKLGGECFFFFGNAEADYPYLEQLPDVKMPMIKNQTPDDFLKFAQANITNDDILFINGASGFEYVRAIRYLYPRILSICAFDMHRTWFINICNEGRTDLWHQIAGKYNVAATSSKSVARQMNEKTDFLTPVFHIPNGFYGEIPKKPLQKENVILTVGRIGTYQKNTESLLEGFAAAAEDFPDWTLRLVGTIDPEFLPYKEQFFEANPNLRDRVIFTGPIIDKSELMKEYENAKIFTLTSRYEGGNPNVFAEALSNGCFMLMCDMIDAAPEMALYGNIGLKYGIDMPLSRAMFLSMSALSDGNFEKIYDKHYAKCREYLENELLYEITAKKYIWLLFANKHIAK